MNHDLNNHDVLIWLEERIAFYRTLSFFQQQREKSNLELAQYLLDESANSYYGALSPDAEFAEYNLLAYDTDRVWQINDYFVLGSEEEFKGAFYPSVLQRLSAISQGKFVPNHIQVSDCGYCNGRDKRLLITFEHEGKNQELSLCIDHDVLVLSFLEELNDMQTGGNSFEYTTDSYGYCIVFYLHKTEKEMLEKLGWRFRRNPYYWFDRAESEKGKEEFDRAEYYYKKAYDQAPHELAIVHGYGDMLLENSKPLVAKHVFSQAVEYLSSLPSLSDNDTWWFNLIQKELKSL